MANTKALAEKAITPANGKPIEEKKPAVEIPMLKPEKKQLPELPPLEDRLHRLNQLFDLQRKYLQLQQSLQKLKTFELTRDDETSYITIRDDSRNEFTTYNTPVIREVVKFIRETISAKIKEIEPQLKW